MPKGFFGNTQPGLPMLPGREPVSLRATKAETNGAAAQAGVIRNRRRAGEPGCRRSGI